MKKRLIHHFLSDDELLRISDTIKKSESTTAGEICVCIKEHLPFYKKNNPIKKLAEKEFFKIGINKTRDKTGILIYILLEGRKFHMLADSGINKKVESNTWNSVKDEMQAMFKKGNFCEGITNAVVKVGEILSAHFPIEPDDTNELSNEVIME
jgi:uncharacterized membrane protein